MRFSLNPRHWFQKRTPSMAEGWAETQNRMRYNALFMLDPDVLVRNLGMFAAGDIGGMERILEEFESRDDKMRVGAFKMAAAVASKPWEIRIAKGEEGSDRAKLHQEVLTRFWNRVTVTDAFCRNRCGGLRMLVKQMMSAQSRVYAVHDVSWRVRGDGELEATFTQVPAWSFENRAGHLRYLRDPGAYTGVEMRDGEWLVTVGEGVGISAAILAMAKRLSWNDWILFSEKCGMPVILGNTSAKQDTPAWNALVSAIKAIAPKTGLLADVESKIQAVPFGGASGQATYRELVETVDRAISALYRGGDLATMSQGQGGVGTNAQDGESELMDADGCAMVSETLQRQIERHVIRFTCGDFEPLAGIVINPPAETEDIDREIKIDMHLAGLGVRLSKGDALSRYGRTEAEGEDDALELASNAPQMGLQGGFNALPNEEQGKTPFNLRETPFKISPRLPDGQGDGKRADASEGVLEAFSKDTSKAAEAVRKFLDDIDAGKDVRAEAAALAERLPELMPEDPAMAAVIAEAMAEEFRSAASDPSDAEDAIALGNEVQRVPAGNGNGGQFTGKTNQPDGTSQADDEHTPEEKKRIAEYEASTDQRIVDFVKKMDTLDNKERNDSWISICDTAPQNLTDKIKDEVGIDCSGFGVELTGSHVKHVDNRHGVSGAQDQSMADPVHFGRINYVLNHFDSVEALKDQNGNQVYSEEFKDRNNKPSPVVNVKMRIDGTIAVQQAVPDSKLRKLRIVSVRIEKRNGGR